ncbi:HPF/RaiA family ribosome-associated protein [Maribacter litopenaei]|uniref:HPF/RaiA family ribosome-associated protein n=1 Tax=Maribacter litopenaei TaxID=2976127 RepID=A0ABY5Y653_9FLAO|nr:HPF/RaiA family ribosome-associated protein [Maribacter litopenaei]UWX54488.1 HPF/RaiA family ribosome-associated protein [Maribacter litopenaei]
MTVNIQYIDMPESESLSEIVTRNLQKLAHKYQFIIRGDIYFKLGQGKDGIDKICEIQLSVPDPAFLQNPLKIILKSPQLKL